MNSVVTGAGDNRQIRNSNDEIMVRPDYGSRARDDDDDEIDLNSIRQGKERDPFVQAGDRIVVHRSNSRYWLNQATSLLSPLNLLNSWVR